VKPLAFGRVPGFAGDVEFAREDAGDGERWRGLALGLKAMSSSLSELCPCKSCRDSLILALSRPGC
jgi:hypothetical protein